MDWAKSMQHETRNISILRFGTFYITDLTVAKFRPNTSMDESLTKLPTKHIVPFATGQIFCVKHVVIDAIC